jgi:cell division inhibitor SepF
MASVWRKTMKYLGLVEDDELDDVEGAQLEDEAVEQPAGALSRRSVVPAGDRPSPLRRSGAMEATAPVLTQPERPEAVIRTIPQSRPSAGTIHRSEPKRFNEARELGERFRDGIPVIMNLQETEDAIARRLVDFASGLVFAQDGKIELVANRVYLMTPRDVEVSAEERERIREGGFYNQF